MSTCNKSHANFTTEFHCLQTSDRIPITFHKCSWQSCSHIIAIEMEFYSTSKINSWLTDALYLLFMNSMHSFILKFFETDHSNKILLILFCLFGYRWTNMIIIIRIKHMPTRVWAQAHPKEQQQFKMWSHIFLLFLGLFVQLLALGPMMLF